MKNIFYKTSTLALLAGVLLSGCDPEIEAPATSAGEANFSKYIAVGNSLTAGYSDGGLYREGQVNSYPAILAQQFKTVGGGEFMQPLFTEDQRNGSGYLRLTGFTSTGSPLTALVTNNLALRSSSGLLTKYLEPINNFGIPDIKVADVNAQGYGSQQGNRYFERITPDNNANQTYLNRLAAANHTFFSLWIGNNDVLAYATSGGAFSQQAYYSITPVNTFDTNFSQLVNTLTANNQKGIVATIPSVTSIPFFTTVGPTVKQLLATNNIPGMVALTGAGNSRIQIAAAQINAAQNSVLFPLTAAAYAPFVAQPTGKYWRDLARQLSPSQDPIIIRLTLAGLLANYQIDTTQLFGLSAGNPLPSALVLDATEQATVAAATTSFNNIIRAQAQAKGLALFDANEYFNSTIKDGITLNGITYSPAYISGNLFSLDGVHPTPRGYAFVANEMIKSINAKYNAKIPTVDETQYRAVLFP